MDSLLPNKEPYKLQVNQKVSLMVGTPIILDDLVKRLKEERKTAVRLYYTLPH